MATNRKGEVPDILRDHAERSGFIIQDWRAVAPDEDSEVNRSRFHLAGTSALSEEAIASLALCELFAHASILPPEQPSNAPLPYSTQYPSDDPDHQHESIFKVKTWQELRQAVQEGASRTTFGYALVKFCAAMPPMPDKPKTAQREDWSRKFTAQWLVDNPSLKPDYIRFTTIRNTQIAHRGAWGDKGGLISSYEVRDQEGKKHAITISDPDPEINFNPSPYDVRLLTCLVESAIMQCAKIEASIH